MGTVTHIAQRRNGGPWGESVGKAVASMEEIAEALIVGLETPDSGLEQAFLAHPDGAAAVSELRRTLTRLERRLQPGCPKFPELPE